jgi:hypothetical protein
MTSSTLIKSPYISRFETILSSSTHDDLSPPTPCMNLVTQAALVLRDAISLRSLIDNVNTQILQWVHDVEENTRQLVASLETRLVKHFKWKHAQSALNDYSDLNDHNIIISSNKEHLKTTK